MIRCTIELLPGGAEDRARTIGCIEIANDGTGDLARGHYDVVLKKQPPFKGALRAAWRAGKMAAGHDDAEIMVGRVEGHHRTRRGAYDLLYRALKACGLEQRNPGAEG